MKTLFFNFIEYIRLKPIMIKYECILSDDDIESLLKQSKIADNITNEYAQWAKLKQIEVKVKHFNFS